MGDFLGHFLQGPWEVSDFSPLSRPLSRSLVMLQRFFGSPKRTPEKVVDNNSTKVSSPSLPPVEDTEPVDFEKVARYNARCAEVLKVMEKERDEARREALLYMKKGQKGAAEAKTRLYMERKHKIDHVVQSQAHVAHNIDNLRTAEIGKYQLGTLREVVKLIKTMVDSDAIDNAHDVTVELRETQAEVGQLNKVISRPPRGMFGRIDDEELEKELENMGNELGDDYPEEPIAEVTPPTAPVVVLDHQGKPMMRTQQAITEW
jgi:hypothetical protein